MLNFQSKNDLLIEAVCLFPLWSFHLTNSISQFCRTWFQCHLKISSPLQHQLTIVTIVTLVLSVLVLFALTRKNKMLLIQYSDQDACNDEFFSSKIIKLFIFGKNHG